MKKGAKEAGFYHVCHCEREKLIVGRVCTKRTMAESLELLSEVDGNGKTVQQTLNAVTDYFVYLLPPALGKFPFLDTCGSVDIFAISGYSQCPLFI